MGMLNFAVVKNVETGDFTILTTPRGYNSHNHQMGMYVELAAKLSTEGLYQPSALMFGDITCNFSMAEREGVIKVGHTPVAMIYTRPTPESVSIGQVGNWPMFLAPYPTLSVPLRNLKQLRDLIKDAEQEIIWRFV